MNNVQPEVLQGRSGDWPVALFAPGRINLLGDHIDYVGGTVFPMTLQCGIWALARPHAARNISVYSHNQVASAVVSLDDPQPGDGWQRFVSGAVQILRDSGVALRGGAIEVAGNIPASSLSSSAALSCLLLRTLLDLAEVQRTPLDIARLARRVEIEHVGVNCGLMDQAAVCLCPAQAVLQFDCAGETGLALPLADEVAVLVLGTGKTRSLRGSPYNSRQADARAALDAGLTLQDLDDPHPAMAATQVRRARHVLSEMARAGQGGAALRAQDWHTFGALMNASHNSLRDDFEVSCAELDVMVQAALQAPGVVGARMSGGGFGGAAVALVEQSAAERALAAINAGYRRQVALEPTLFVARSVGPLQAVSP